MSDVTQGSQHESYVTVGCILRRRIRENIFPPFLRVSAFFSFAVFSAEQFASVFSSRRSTFFRVRAQLRTPFNQVARECRIGTIDDQSVKFPSETLKTKKK